MLKSAIEKIEQLCKPMVLEKDGHTYVLAARRTVKDYLTEKLAKEIEGGLVFVAM